MADRSDRLPPYRRPEGAEDLFTPAAGISLPGEEPPPPPRPMSRREAREAARRAEAAGGVVPVTAPAPPPADDVRPVVQRLDDGWPLGTPTGPDDAAYTDDPADPADRADPADARRPVAPPRRPVRPGRRWTIPLVALLLAGWSATVFADAGGLLGVAPVVLATLVPLVSVVAVPVAAVAARRRRWESLVVVVLAGLLPWGLVAGYATTAPPPAAAGDPVTVLVVNAHGGRADADQIVAAVRAHQVDVLVVTELSRSLAHDLTEARLGSYLLPQWFQVKDAPDAGLGVWSNADLTDPQVVAGTRWPAVRLGVPSRSGELTLVAGHAVPPLPSRVDRWHADLTALGESVRGRRHALLVGTFNASPWHAAYRSVLASSGLVDAADEQGTGLRPTWPTWTPLPLVPLDAALVTRDLHVVSADTVPVAGTDHRALLVTLEIPGDATSAD